MIYDRIKDLREPYRSRAEKLLEALRDPARGRSEFYLCMQYDDEDYRRYDVCGVACDVCDLDEFKDYYEQTGYIGVEGNRTAKVYRYLNQSTFLPEKVVDYYGFYYDDIPFFDNESKSIDCMMMHGDRYGLIDTAKRFEEKMLYVFREECFNDETAREIQLIFENQFGDSYRNRKRFDYE